MDKKELYNSINQHLSRSDDNSENDTNDVPEDALVFSNDIKRERNGDDD